MDKDQYTLRGVEFIDGKAQMKKTWFLTAGETNAAGKMPITLVVERAIEIATEHANALGIGYSKLAEHRLGWVLARLSVEVVRYPDINEVYSMTTWIEGYNRFFSDRCYEMNDAEGRPLAYIRSMWVAIDMQTRTMADLCNLEREKFPVVERTCPLAKLRAPLIKKGTPVDESEYTFKYCDIDFNRHVNTIRYLDLVLNQNSMEFYDKHTVRRLDVSFEHECYYGQTVRLLTGDGFVEPLGRVTEIHNGDQRAVAVKLVYDPPVE